MNYKIMNKESELFVRDAINVIGSQEMLDEATIEYLLIKFDSYLDWINGNDEVMPDLSKKFIVSSFYAFFYGVYSGADYFCKVNDSSDLADSAINNIKAGNLK